MLSHAKLTLAFRFPAVVLAAICVCALTDVGEASVLVANASEMVIDISPSSNEGAGAVNVARETDSPSAPDEEPTYLPRWMINTGGSNSAGTSTSASSISGVGGMAVASTTTTLQIAGDPLISRLLLETSLDVPLPLGMSLLRPPRA